MRIPEGNVTYVVLSVYLLRLSIDIHLTGSSLIKYKVNLIQLKTFELKRDFAQYIQYINVPIADLCWAPYMPSTG